MRFRHVCLMVRDLERSIDFYCRHLGFQRGPAFTGDAGKPCGMFLYLNNGTFLELFIGEPQVAFGHLCFEADNVAEEVKRLRAEGLDVSDPSLGRSKAWMAFFKDPDGYALELNEFSPPDSWIGCFLSENDPAQQVGLHPTARGQNGGYTVPR